MNHRVNLGVLVKDGIESLLVSQVDIVEGWTAATELLNAAEDIFEGVVEVVDNDDIVTVFEKCQGGEGANVPSTTVTTVSPARLRSLCARQGYAAL